ncbi:MAG: WGR domain-containing protein [Nannocystaceae bacterium]|nr:WGR domain-containing protein [Nannocystaceae bacterium]
MSAREFVLVDEGSSKFWRIELNGPTHTVTYGRIGTDGRTTAKTFESDDAAKLAAGKLVASKLKKGYSETTGKKTTAKNKPRLKDLRTAQAQAGLPSDSKARAALVGDLQQWVATTVPIDLDRVNFQFVPDLESENWFESAVLKGQKFGAALNVGTVFGGCLTTLHSVEHGDIVCDQYVRGARRQVLWVHDEGFLFVEGGDPDFDPEVVSGFAADWVERAEALSEAAQLLPTCLLYTSDAADD